MHRELSFFISKILLSQLKFRRHQHFFKARHELGISQFFYDSVLGMCAPNFTSQNQKSGRVYTGLLPDIGI